MEVYVRRTKDEVLHGGGWRTTQSRREELQEGEGRREGRRRRLRRKKLAVSTRGEGESKV